MSNQVPQFDNESIAELARHLYGLEGEISPLVSYDDQNARIQTSEGAFVFKIANRGRAIEELELQNKVLEHLKMTAPDLGVPRVLSTRDGEAMTDVDGFVVRLFTYLEGRVLGESPRSPALYHEIGLTMGRFSEAMRGYAPPPAREEVNLWQLDNVLACKPYLNDVVDANDRARITRFLDHYEVNLVPRLRGLRKSVIHGDANEQNILVTGGSPNKVAGLVDFGDVHYGTHVNELAITLAYALLGEDELKEAAQHMIRGYTQVFELEPEELEVLPDLVPMRLVQSLLMTSHDAKEFPENRYIPVSQKPARALLKKLEEVDFSVDDFKSV